MSLRYDVLAIDLDGTLLTSEGNVSNENVKAIERARDAGMEIVIATGRSLAESKEAIAAIDHQGVLIAAGGSLLCDTTTGATLARRAMPETIVREVTRWLVEHEHPALILKDAHVTGYDYLVVGNGRLDPASQWWFDRMASVCRHVPHLEGDAHPADTIRAGAVAEEGRLAPLAQRLRKEFDGLCAMQHWSAVTATHAIGSPTHLLEIFDAHVSKWSMLLEHCRPKDISHHRIAAIGDGLNDIDLVANAGLGIAMGNAVLSVRSVAKCSTCHHDEHGVARAIDQILNGAW